MNNISSLTDEEWSDAVRLMGPRQVQTEIGRVTAKRVDNNQAEIVAALRAAGASVVSLASVGHGCADLLVGVRHNNYLLEVKSKGGRLTEDESMWHAQWRGQVVVVRNVEEALYCIGAVEERPVLVRVRGEA